MKPLKHGDHGKGRPGNGRGNVETARADILEVGQLYQTANSRVLKWACVTGVSIAEGTKPDATVDSVLGAIYVLNNETRAPIFRRPGFFGGILLLVFFLTINRYNIISDVYFQKQD